MKKEKKEKIDYSKFFWKPQPGKHQLRIVPSLLNKEDPFQEVFLHYGLQKFPIFALTNWGESDPIVDFAKKLRTTGEKDDYFLSKKLSPKERYFAPVIVRGEEEKGVRLWEFGKGVYKQFLSFATNEDYGDFTDVVEGFDFTVDAVTGEVAGTPATLINSIQAKRKSSPLSSKAADVELWLKEQPNALELQRKHSYDELKDILNKWLTGKDGDEESTKGEEPVVDDLPWSKPKEDRKGKFDELFNN